MRFREDIHPPATPGLIEGDSLVLSESNSTFYEPPSPQINNQNNTMKNRQRHDSVKKRIFKENLNFVFCFLGNFLYTCNALWIKIC
jgi:hypothetical protein